MLKKFAEWSTADMNDLPDSSFAYISSGGKKDKDGKTTPRSLRHLPYKDKDGKVDLPHLRNALARLDSTEIPESAKAGIKSKLEGILEKEKAKASEMFIGSMPLEFEEAHKADDQEVPDLIHLIPIGQWDHDLYGPIILQAADIKEFVKNFDDGLRKGVPITAGHEGFQELPAVGWITGVQARDTGLWGSVQWNASGKGLLADKAFKFFSPEFYQEYEDPETHKVYKNVLVGGALTKSPYFKELEAVIASDKKLKLFSTMNLQDLLAKKPEELSEAEKAFVKENVATLTEEQKTAFATVLADAPVETEEEKAARIEKETGDANEAKGLNRDGSVKTEVQASDKKMVMIPASELSALRSKANEGAAAFAEMQKVKLDTATASLTFSESNKAGKFLPKSKDTLRSFMEKLTETQRTQFVALMAELPKTELFAEKGGTSASEGTAMAEIETKVNAKIAASGNKMKYSEGLRQVLAENPELEKRYNTEIGA